MWTKEELEHAIDLRKKGCTYQQIADKMGISQAACYGRINRTSYRKQVEMSRDFDESELERMREMRVKGRSIQEIADYFGCPRETISMQLKAFGVIRRDYLESDVRFAILRMYREGYPYSAIGRELDLTSAEARYAILWMRQHGEV